MENKEYTPGQNRPGRRGGMRGPGMGRGPAEKASDFKGTWSNLISYCKSYLPVDAPHPLLAYLQKGPCSLP